jgi:hypothetical protein
MSRSPRRAPRALVLVVLALLTVASAASAGGPAKGQEDPSLRTAHSSTTVDALGRHVLRLYPAAVNYRDANGAWQPVDNTLVSDSSGGATNAANSFQAALPSDLSGPVSFSTAAGSVSFRLAGAHGHGSVSGSRDTYAAALPGVDVAYAVGNAGVKETLTLANAAAPTSFDYDLSTSNGITPRLNRSGGIDFVDGSGNVAFAFAPPSMVDASGAVSERVQFHLEHGGTSLALVADKRWLSAANRAWPVVVDPSFIAQGADNECFIRDGVDADSSFCGGSSVDVGGDGTQTSRTLLVWDVSWALPSNAIVQDAELGLYLQDEATTTPIAVDVNQVTTPWTAATTWNAADTGSPWTTAGGDFAAPAAATATVGGSTGVTTTWNLTQLVQGWANGSIPNDGMLLTSSPAANVLHFATTSAPQTSEMPYLQVVYDTTPDTTITSGPSGSTTSASASFAFTSDTYGSAFECSLDGATFTACTSPKAYASVAAGSHTFQVRAVSPGGTADPTPATRTWTIAKAGANLLANGSFEGSVAGWSATNATLTQASDGVVGSGAVKVTFASGTSYSIRTSPAAVGSTTAGAVYRAGGWFRSAVTGRSICLAVRELSSTGSLVGSVSTCPSSATSWKQFASVAYTARRSGDSLELMFSQASARTGDSFELDGLTLTQG